MTAVLREQFLQSIENNDLEYFLSVIQRHNCKTDMFDVDELLSGMERKQKESMWRHLHNKCGQSLISIGLTNTTSMETRQLLKAIVTLAIATIQDSPVIIDQPFFDTVVLCHGVLLDLPDNFEEVQELIVVLCEQWQQKNLTGFEELLMNTVEYLLRSAINSTQTSGSYVKRLWKLHTKLLCVKDIGRFRHQSFVDVTSSLNILKVPEGRKFVAALFTVNNGSLIYDLHNGFKRVIPSANKIQMDWIAEVYFKSWKNSSGQLTQKIEEMCIQELMYSAIHVSRGNNLSANLRQLLKLFTKHKKEECVSRMMFKLYEPIMWRSLKVANSDIRANTVCLLLDAFPLKDPRMNCEANEIFFNKQITIIKELLMDNSSVVRSIVAEGVCRITACYYQLISSEVLQQLFHLIVSLSADVSSVAVRFSVVQGLSYMLTSSITYPLLQTVLPNVCNLFHDSSDKVRLAMVNLLLKTRGMKTIKYWDIIPMDSILEQIQVEKSNIASKLVELIFKSFLPINKPLNIQLTRTIYLIQTNQNASRVFYSHAHLHTSIDAIVKLITYICLYINALINTTTMNKQIERDCLLDVDEGNNKENETAETSDDGDLVPIDVKDTRLLSALFDVVVILWTGSYPKLQQTHCTALNNGLIKKVAPVIPGFLTNFQDQRIANALVTIVGFLPAISVPNTVSVSLLSKLSSMDNLVTSRQFGSVLDTLCQWNKGHEVLELILSWLNASFLLVNSSSNTSTRRSSRVAPPRLNLALSCLEYIFQHNVCLYNLINNEKLMLLKIRDCLSQVLKLAEERLSTQRNNLAEPFNDDVLLLMIFEKYLRMLSGLKEEASSRVPVLEKIVDWANVHLERRSDKANARRRRLLRAADCTMTDPNLTSLGSLTQDTTDLTINNVSVTTVNINKDFSLLLIDKLICWLRNVLLAGLWHKDIYNKLVQLIVLLLDNDELISSLMSLIYQTVDIYKSDTSLTSYIHQLLIKLIDSLTNLMLSKPNRAQLVFNSLQTSMSEIFLCYFRHIADRTMDKVISHLLTTMVNDIVQTIETTEHDNIEQLPLLSSLLTACVLRQPIVLTQFRSTLQDKLNSLSQHKELLAVGLLIITINRAKPNRDDWMNCVRVIQQQLHNYDDDMPCRELQVVISRHLDELMTNRDT